MALSDKQLAFCYEYVVDYDRMEAMKRINYSGKHPSVQAYNWLENPEIKAKINELQNTKNAEASVHAYQVLNEMKLIMDSDIRDFIDDDNNIISLKKLPPSKTRAVSGITKTKRFNMFGEEETTVKLQFWDKVAILDKLGKHLGIFEQDNRQKQPLIQVVIE